MRIDDHTEDVFPDSVYGQIRVPKTITKYIVDTEVFQRLRSVEQTGGSMRALYPTARHDRFSHSLGVFHLGRKAFNTLRKQYSAGAFKDNPISEDSPFRDEEWWEKQYFIFMIACLLHDCAHAPFSHTFESFFEMEKCSYNPDGIVEQIETIRKNKETFFPMARLDYEMLQEYSIGDHLGFLDDYMSSSGLSNKGCGSPHERMSALVVKKYFFRPMQDAACEYGIQVDDVDCQYIARMIIGCPFTKGVNPELSFINCLVALLNSNVVDVDKLDYIVRDTATSGMSNWNIDCKAIISSFRISLSQFMDDDVSSIEPGSHVWRSGTTLAIEPSRCGDAAQMVLSGSAVFVFDSTRDADSFTSSNQLQSKRGSVISLEGCNRVKLDFEKVLTQPVTITLQSNCLLQLEGLKGSIQGVLVGIQPDQKSNPNALRFTLGYKSEAISALLSAIDARNNFHRWAYVDPNVLYNADFLKPLLLKWSAKFLCCSNHNKENMTNSGYPKRNCNDCPAKGEEEGYKPIPVDDLTIQILGLEGFYNPDAPVSENTLLLGHCFCRSNDDDLQALFKQVYLQNQCRGAGRNKTIDTFFGEYFSRVTKRPLWGSFAEYKKYCLYHGIDALEFSALSALSDTSMDKGAYLYGLENTVEISALLHTDEDLGDCVIVKAKANVKTIDANNVLVVFDDGSVARLRDVCSNTIDEDTPDFFYVYT